MRLKLRWARFFTLVGGHWTLAAGHAGYDFVVTIPCCHSECNGSHKLTIRVCDKNHADLIAKHNSLFDIEDMYRDPHPALFGSNPSSTHWQMVHGNGGGYYTVDYWFGDASKLWESAYRD